MTDGYTHSAVAAAVEVAQRYGLPADDPEVLHERSNVLVRLGSAVARVPGTTRLVRGTSSAWLARDVALSGFLTERGVRVVSPLSDPPAGPHFAGGLPVTLWHFTPHERDHRYTPREMAESLAEEVAELAPFRELQEPVHGVLVAGDRAASSGATSGSTGSARGLRGVTPLRCFARFAGCHNAMKGPFLSFFARKGPFIAFGGSGIPPKRRWGR